MNKYLDSYYFWWKNIDKIIFTILILLFVTGLFFSLVSTSLIASDKLDTNSYYFFLKHLSFILLGMLALFVISILNQEFLIKFSIILFFFTFLALILVPIIGIEVKGSKRWIDIAFLPRFQPIELVKPFFVILLSIVLTLNKKNLYFKYFLSAIIVSPLLLLLISQPDIGQTMLISSVWLSLIFVSGISFSVLFILFSIFGLIITYLIIFVEKFEYIKIRLTSFLDTSSGNNYQADKATDAIINGGFFGRGIGEGKLNSLVPEAHTDYIISVISEEFGVIIVILILILYLIFSYKVIQKINTIQEARVKLILIGCITTILFQTFVHIGVNIRLLPTTGMTLPFLSYGGSSIIGTSIISGLILNFTKRRVN